MLGERRAAFCPSLTDRFGETSSRLLRFRFDALRARRVQRTMRERGPRGSGTKEKKMHKITLTVAATSAILSAASLIPGAANASPLGAATNANLQLADTSVQQVNWWGGAYYRPYHRFRGPYAYYHRPYFHRRFFYGPRFHRFHRYGYGY